MGRHRLVLDCGMHPKDTGEDALPNFKAIAGREIEAILISHAHQDHIGTLPVLMRRFPTARIFMTETTAEIGSVLLHNSVNVMTRQREEIGRTVAVISAFHASRNRSRIGTLALVSVASAYLHFRRTCAAARERCADIRVFRRRTRAGLDRNSSARAKVKLSFTPGTSISTIKQSWKRRSFRKRRSTS